MADALDRIPKPAIPIEAGEAQAAPATLPDLSERRSAGSDGEDR
jgi:hypothetical protein